MKIGCIFYWEEMGLLEQKRPIIAPRGAADAGGSGRRRGAKLGAKGVAKPFNI